MKEIFSPFTSKEKLLHMGLCILVFIGMAVPFKVMVLIEGLTEVRPVNAVPVVAGLLLGPAGAWGCAIGNLIADFFGTFSKASILGFIGNFIAAYLPYKLWHFTSRSETPNVKTYKNLTKYILITAIAALTTALIIVCGLDILFGIWIPKIFWIILFNNICFPLLIGLPIFIVLTSEESAMKITVPERFPSEGKEEVSSRSKYFFLAVFVSSELTLLWMICSGIQMSTTFLMYIMVAVFTLTLSILVFSQSKKNYYKKRFL